MLMTVGACALIIVLWSLYYRRVAVARPRLTGRASAFNRRVVARIPRLSRPYRPTPWAFNCHLQLLWVLVQEAVAPGWVYEHSEQLTMVDGGTSALHWVGLNAAPETPTLVVLHTISGDAQGMRGLVADMHRATGWRVVVCTRRGHGDLELTAARYNTMGDTDDLREQLQRVREQVPDAPLYGVGVSAGAVPLVRYLGEEGDRSLLRAGVAYCPGYDIGVAFERVHRFYSRYIAGTLKRRFLAPYAHYFGHLESYRAALAAPDLAELQRQIYEIAGYRDLSEYLQYSNPVGVLEHISVPLLAINADDDPICVHENTLPYIDTIRRLPAALLVQTRRGSHCAFFEGWTARPWAHGLIADYVTAVATEFANNGQLSPRPHGSHRESASNATVVQSPP